MVKQHQNKITRKYRLKPDLLAKMRAHACKWTLTETSIVERSLKEFFAVKRVALEKD